MWKLKLNKIKVSEFKIVILHVGTNDLKKCPDISKPMDAIITLITSRNKGALIVISAILPRPKDTAIEDGNRKTANAKLKDLAKTRGCEFLHTWRPFTTKAGAPKEELYAQDGLHLNHKGTKALKNYFDGTVIRLKGKLAN